MDLVKVLKLLKKRGLAIDLDCVYSVNFSKKKILITYQGNIEIDKKLVCKNE